MAASLVIDDEREDCRESLHPHKGYYAGEFRVPSIAGSVPVADDHPPGSISPLALAMSLMRRVLCPPYPSTSNRTTGHIAVQGSDWSLSRKYGCSPREAVQVLRCAAAHGLVPAGASFHVGSQQRDPQAWDAPIAAAGRDFASVRASGLAPWLLDLGGGFPAHLEGRCPPLASYGAAIEVSLRRPFGAHRPATLVEPGSAVVADAGTLVSTVIGVVRRGDARWVYLDAGVFTGLVETLDEAIRYRLWTSVDGGPTGHCVLAGPTCDSADVLYEHTPVQLPLSLREGDAVRLLSTGAYTSCYSTVGFNGFDPLRTHLVP